LTQVKRLLYQSSLTDGKLTGTPRFINLLDGPKWFILSNALETSNAY